MSAPLAHLTRRSLIAAAAFAPLLGAARAAASIEAQLPLWPDNPPGGGGPGGEAITDKKGAVSNISRPSLTRVSPSQPNGAAVLIAAGGGYKRIEMAMEADPAAAWLAARGVTAFILSYRLPGEGWTAGNACALQDAQRAIRLIRANARSFGVDPQKLGVLGFSAGGHLLGLASAWSDFASSPAIDSVDEQSARPDACALIYPVITLEAPYDKTSTRKVLVGQAPSAAQAREWSVQTHVRARCPDMFLAQAEDDPISDPHNTLIMAQACRDAAVPVEMHRFANGAHGFGMGRPGTESAQWPEQYATWLRARKFLA